MHRHGWNFGMVVAVGLSFLMGACTSFEQVLHDLEDDVGAGGASGKSDAGVSVRPPADVGMPFDSGTCVDSVLCTATDHWDPKLCKCVPNVCVDNVFCGLGSHWSVTACRCEPDHSPSDGGICNGGCLCGNPSESQCTAEACERVYTRQPDGSLKYDYCTNGPSGSVVLDGGSP